MTGNLRIDILFQRVSGDKNVQSEPVNDLKDLHHKTEEFLPNVSGAAILWVMTKRPKLRVYTN